SAPTIKKTPWMPQQSQVSRAEHAGTAATECSLRRILDRKPRTLTQVSWPGSIAAEGALFVMIWAPPKPEFPRGLQYAYASQSPFGQCVAGHGLGFADLRNRGGCLLPRCIAVFIARYAAAHSRPRRFFPTRLQKRIRSARLHCARWRLKCTGHGRLADR